MKVLPEAEVRQLIALQAFDEYRKLEINGRSIPGYEFLIYDKKTAKGRHKGVIIHEEGTDYEIVIRFWEDKSKKTKSDPLKYEVEANSTYYLNGQNGWLYKRFLDTNRKPQSTRVDY